MREITVGVSRDSRPYHNDNLFRYLHPYHKEAFFVSPPKKVKYVQTGEMQYKKIVEADNPIKKYQRSIERGIIYSNKKDKVDLVQVHNSFILNNVNWVGEFDRFWATYPTRKSHLLEYQFNQILSKISGKKTGYWQKNEDGFKTIQKVLAAKNCKKIIPVSKWAENKCKKYINPKTWKKIEVVRPAVGFVKSNPKKNNQNQIKLLFVGYKFLAKGGDCMLDAFDALSEKYDVQLTVVTGGWFEKQHLKRMKENNQINFQKPVNKNELFKNYYQKADIFVSPTTTATYGFALLDAMACGLPVISTNSCAIPEIVDNKKTGLLIDISKYYGKMLGRYYYSKWKDAITKGLIEKISLLIEDSALRKKFGQNGRTRARKQFSIKRFNKKMRKIYEEAL